ncbi:MAG TPA: suppressor of fused domain protein [Abditibacterium sp.]
MSRYQTELELHLEKHAGPIETRWENMLLVRATEERQCHVVVTDHLSDEPMIGCKSEWKWAELCALLPSDWPLDPAQWENPEFGWPARELQRLVSVARESETWLGFGHTVPNGDPPQPFAPSTEQCASFLLPPLELSPSFARLRLSDGEILNFWAIVPIYAGELALKVNQKAPSLIEKLSTKGVSDLIDPTRPDVFQKSKKPGGFKRWVTGR